MAPSKRRELTTDDLLRMQEGPPQKRSRKDFEFEDNNDDNGEEGSSFQGFKVSSEDDNTSDGGSGTDNTGSGDHSDQEDIDEDEHKSIKPPTKPSSKSLSRVSIVPRKELPLSRSKPAPPTNQPREESFSSFGISSALLAALAAMSIRVPTEIQAVCIPPLLEGEYNPRL